MNLQALKTNLAAVMPLLNANLEAAHAEYLAGDLAAGAYSYVCSRHSVAQSIVAKDDVPPEIAYQACALLAIDLRTGVKDAQDKADAQAKVDAWWECYREAGYTEINPFYDSPMLPDTQSQKVN